MVCFYQKEGGVFFSPHFKNPPNLSFLPHPFEIPAMSSCPLLSPSIPPSHILLLAPLSLGKTLKSALEQRGLLDKEENISRVLSRRLNRGCKDDDDDDDDDNDADTASAGADAGRIEEEEEEEAAAVGAMPSSGMRMKEATNQGEERSGCVWLLCFPTTITVDSTTLREVPLSSKPHSIDPPQEDFRIVKKSLLDRINMVAHTDTITLLLRPSLSTTTPAAIPAAKTTSPRPRIKSSIPSLLARVIDEWSLRLTPDITSTASPTSSLPSLGKKRSCRYSYTIYPPMLLLPARTWSLVTDLLACASADGAEGARECGGMMTMRRKKELMDDLYGRLCEAFKVTHVALSGPIPATMLEDAQGRSDDPSSTDSTASSYMLHDTTSEENREKLPFKNLPSPVSSPTPNILRSPLNSFTPLYNDFGPHLPAHHVPTRDDFGKAFWCTVRQNGIFQTWTPRHTMFSHGNLSEKTRLLKLLSAHSRTTRMDRRTADEKSMVGLLGTGGINEEEKEPREGGSTRGEMISAVDLYAGVGYFAFCYAAEREVVGKVFCWEISRWSVEGLRRGAAGNGWGVRVFEEGEQDNVGEDGAEKEGKEEERLIVYRESNQHAAARIEALRARIPPVRHVNCGFLPSSKESWETAVLVLDPIQGGWIHAHENIAVRAFGFRRMEIVQGFRDLVKRHHQHGNEEQQQWEVECVHFEQVKRYAPGVVHCVLDIFISRLQRPRY